MLSPVCFSGCPSQNEHDLGANQSLVEIGERALEQGEQLEARGDRAGANVSYRKALWAFQYHRQLTGEEAFLADEASEGVQRTAARTSGSRSPNY